MCSLPDAEASASDARRLELAELWAKVHVPLGILGEHHLRLIVRALGLMREEGFHANADDFTDRAASICAYYSDWASAKYWAKMAYEARAAEFGKDSHRADEVRPMHLYPNIWNEAGGESRSSWYGYEVLGVLLYTFCSLRVPFQSWLCEIMCITPVRLWDSQNPMLYTLWE